jgi:hypothetical protein
MKPFERYMDRVLSDIRPFSQLIIQLPLREYQLRALRPILESVLRHEGREFLLVFPRQSGKNEAVAHLLAYLLNLYRRTGGNIVYGAMSHTLGMGRQRLENRLDNCWNRGEWSRRATPDRVCLGRASVTFLSTHPQAGVRGLTADDLLVIDEAQEQDASHVEAVFTPMRAAHNATALYIGTVKLTTDFLWTKKQELEAETARDGKPRVFLVPPGEVTAACPDYRRFLDGQVAKHGRNHPIVASEYFLEPIDGSGGLFDARRRDLMRGCHARQTHPRPGALTVATLDVAGEDEAPTDALAQLAHPGRDYTVATVFEVEMPGPGAPSPGPTYRAVDVFVDHGSRHFEAVPGRPSLVERLAGWLEHWQVAHLVADRSGVGMGLVAWLAAALGEHRVTGYDLGRSGAKASLGTLFLGLVETRRFQYWQEGGNPPLSDAWWFFKQAEACSYQVPSEGSFERDLRWGVPPGHRTSTPLGPQPTHDDRLLSAALVAELDRLLRTGRLTLGAARSTVIARPDPLGGDVY